MYLKKFIPACYSSFKKYFDKIEGSVNLRNCSTSNNCYGDYSVILKINIISLSLFFYCYY